MPLSTIFQLYHDGQFYWWRKPECCQTWSHNVVSNTPRLSEVRTHNNSGDRHWLHRLLKIQLPYDYNHDSPCLNRSCLLLLSIKETIYIGRSSVNEWWLFNTKWVIFQLYHGMNKLHLMKLWWCLLFTGPKCLLGTL